MGNPRRQRVRRAGEEEDREYNRGVIWRRG